MIAQRADADRRKQIKDRRYGNGKEEMRRDKRGEERDE
jgi:hypothetical protein